MAEKLQQLRVVYCIVCGLPSEYCEFGPDFEQCKPWLIQNSPHTYPDLPQRSFTFDVSDAISNDTVIVSDQHKATSINCDVIVRSGPADVEVVGGTISAE